MHLALADDDTLERPGARDACQALMRRVVVTPDVAAGARAQFKVTVETSMAALLARDGHIVAVGAGTGFEPVTFRL
jgi:hypothetical protein